MDAPWLQLDDVHLFRGDREVLRGVTANLRGQAVGLVGANGAGKTTLMAALLGVLRPRSGSVKVLGHTLPDEAMTVRTRAGVMAEQAGVFPGGSAVDAVAFAGALNGLDRQTALRRAHRALDALGVGEERYRPTSDYSTGMRQKCKLAMCLVHEPDVLFLDEPTVGLDPVTRTQLLGIVRDLRDRGLRILLSTHIMHDAEVVCDEMLLLDAGRVAYVGSTAGLLGERGQQMVARGRGIDTSFGDALAEAGVAVAASEQARVVFAGTDDALRAFWRLAAERGVEVRYLGAQARTLEEAVVQAMEAPHG